MACGACEWSVVGGCGGSPGWGVRFTLAYGTGERRRRCRRPPDARESPALSNLAGLLERQGLPQTLLCSGTTWRAVGLGGFRNEQRLAPVKPGIAGYTLLHERGARRDEPPRLYIRAGERGPLARVYVRYEPAP